MHAGSSHHLDPSLDASGNVTRKRLTWLQWFSLIGDSPHTTVLLSPPGLFLPFSAGKKRSDYSRGGRIVDVLVQLELISLLSPPFESTPFIWAILARQQ
jgi:hypothetical protein